MLVNRIHLYVDNGGIPDPLQVNGPLNLHYRIQFAQHPTKIKNYKEPWLFTAHSQDMSQVASLTLAYDISRQALMESFPDGLRAFYLWPLAKSGQLYVRFDSYDKALVDYESTVRKMCEYALWNRQQVDVLRVCSEISVQPISIVGVGEPLNDLPMLAFRVGVRGDYNRNQ